MTVLIGPQASGKSVISKLMYFFINITSKQFTWIYDSKSIDSFSDGIIVDFRKWFPPSAWGDARFLIIYEAGPIWIKLQRGVPRKGKQSEKIKITYSDYFAEEYDKLLQSVRSKRKPSPNEDDLLSPASYDAFYRLQNSAQKQLEKDLGQNYIRSQLFVPAGRSFFTSIGKAVAAFEQGGILDPLTVTFGRLFSNLRDRGRDLYYIHDHPRNKNYANELGRQLFSGEVRFARDEEYVASNDGRKIPFSALSSGQQELLPLWLTLDFFNARSVDRNLIYIEEPEAHLFPTAQSLLVEYLSSIVATYGQVRQYMLITTHSPYMLAKMNNLLKAGQLGQTKSLADRVEQVVKKEAWLRARYTRSYAILDRKLVSIMDEDGLIAADYLDDVSGAISDEYLKLLAIDADRGGGR